MEHSKIRKINEIVENWFAKNPTIEKIPAKELMSEFIVAGIYTSNHRDGLPLREDLRELDERNNLHAIKHLEVERHNKNRSWYFVRNVSLKTEKEEFNNDTSSTPSLSFKNNNVKKDSISNGLSFKTNSRSNSDESYIIDLCDEVLNRKADRQKRFNFLKGDSGTLLPVDAYYDDLKLVIEYREKQHTESVSFFDRRQTVSGVGRGEQRKIYDERRRLELPKHGISLLEFDYSEFVYTSSKQLIRNYDSDLMVVMVKLQNYF